MLFRSLTGSGLGETFYPFFHFGWSPLRFLRTERFKYIEAPRPELYDLREDPGETRNLIETQRSIAQQMRTQLSDGLRRFTARDAAAANRPADAATLEKLKSLGYVASATQRPLSGAADYRKLSDRKSTRLNSSHIQKSRMPSSA